MDVMADRISPSGEDDEDLGLPNPFRGLTAAVERLLVAIPKNNLKSFM